MNRLQLKKQIEEFFIEDIGYKDLTSDSIFENQEGQLQIVSKSNGIFCGEDIIRVGYSSINPLIEVKSFVHDGDQVEVGQMVAQISGPVKDLLTGERVVLNLIQRMSGIATKTNSAVKLLNSRHTRISDTRKTTPGLRMLEKYAVTKGGGINHRYGLDHAVMIKDNHIAFCGSITEAVHKVQKQVGHMIKVVVEVEDQHQVLEAVDANVDCILLDNIEVKDLPDLLNLIPTTVLTEVSGGITLQDLPKYSNLPVDVISLGCLTHQIESLDISADVKIYA
ncbi:carboxylating nicotinate-nucleotide diphosphorylase [Piscibacillus salipiscarius]|uniref:nicotinate-nucleotide diphosphorylase (carboxylating) n=1 Tax=Piscibacillus salipiscarius TaxID=299480 RepID=A0ABW5Q858_9BACI